MGSLLARCGVATVAIYFPGFHQSVDNDMLWGEKWTEWDNLFTNNGSVPLLHDAKAHNELLHPQRGYYDIWDAHARTIRAQAQQAAAAGFQAFMFYHYWFAHGRTALTRPVEDALFSATSGAPRRLGLSFFFSWANEPWEKRWNVAVADRTATSKPITLIPQEYGGPKSWQAHFDFLLRFFRHPDYTLHRGTHPIIAIYDAGHFSSGGDRKRDAERRALCNASDDGAGCVDAQFGCAAARLYLQWYPHLATFLTAQIAPAYHFAQGAKLGYSWPGSDPCANRDRDSSNLLKHMLALWQSLARKHGFLGLHILGTLNHANDAGGVVDAMGGAQHVGGLLQFLPTALLRTRPPDWSHRGGFKQCNTHSDTPNNCSCFLKSLGTDQVDQVFTRSIANKGPNLGFARGAMASWSSFPRGRNKAGWALCSNRSPYAYGKLVHSQLLRAVSDAGGSARCAQKNARAKSSDVAAWRHLVVVNAWNEWGEQAVVEPSVQDGDEMLLAHRRAVEDVEKHVMAQHHHLT